MNPLIFEAKLIGFKECLKIGLIWLVFYSYLLSNKKRSLIRPFYAGLFVSLLLGLLVLFLPENLSSKDIIGNVIYMSFALFLVFSGMSLYHSSGVNLFGRVDFFRHSGLSAFIVFSMTSLFILPDIAGSLLYLGQLGLMEENVMMTFLSAVAGFVIAGVIIFAVVKLYKPYWLGDFFGLPQLLLFLAMVKLFGSGINGIAELSLIPSVQKGFVKFTHDLVHQTFVLLMVPDHLILKKTTWDFIGIFFGPGAASAASFIILLSIPAIFIYHSLFQPLPELSEGTRVSRRMSGALILSDRRKKALPVILFAVFIAAAWFSYGGEQVSAIYKPEPRPVIQDNGMVLIPLKDPSADLNDGMLHTFSLIHEGEVIRIITIKKADNSLSVSLDACEICPPEGYGQREGHVVCLYCSTPIPVDTLGEPGGCNPIPLTVVIDENFVRIEMKEILKKWSFVNALKNDEVAP
jgi:hypothetical protein